MILPREQQVCSVESSQKLKLFGFPQESLFYWVEAYDQMRGYHFVLNNCKSGAQRDVYYSAYTCSELGELLPNWWYSMRLDGNRGWGCYDDEHRSGDDPLLPPEFLCSTEVEARAKMLIYLVEHGIGERKE